jgi:uncharacterized membrane protein YphA (DoxX/SURF4 family)
LADYRRQLGVGAIIALVLLRLAIGWHFFREGLDKLSYDYGTRQYHVAFSAESFLSQAKGPLADRFHAWAPIGHDLLALLAVPRQSHAPTTDEVDQRAKWQSDYDQRRAAAEKKNDPTPIEFPPFAPYHDWAVRITDDWRATLSNVTALPSLSDDQRRHAADAFVQREQQLADYLAAQADAIADYQHELWRLEGCRAEPEAASVPYLQKRIAAKAAETAAAAMPWVNQVRDFEQKFVDDLRGLLTTEQKAQATTTQAFEKALTNPQQERLIRLNIGVTILTIAVGACLIVGFFTRLASLAGALFLLAVVATQPPWIASAAPTYNQIIEFAALLVLAGTGAGRWLGLDYITYAIFRSRRDIDD